MFLYLELYATLSYLNLHYNNLKPRHHWTLKQGHKVGHYHLKNKQLSAYNCFNVMNRAFGTSKPLESPFHTRNAQLKFCWHLAKELYVLAKMYETLDQTETCQHPSNKAVQHVIEPMWEAGHWLEKSQWASGHVDFLTLLLGTTWLNSALFIQHLSFKTWQPQELQRTIFKQHRQKGF